MVTGSGIRAASSGHVGDVLDSGGERVRALKLWHFQGQKGHVFVFPMKGKVGKHLSPSLNTCVEDNNRTCHRYVDGAEALWRLAQPKLSPRACGKQASAVQLNTTSSYTQLLNGSSPPWNC